MRRAHFLIVVSAALVACQPAGTELTDSMKAEIAAEVDAAASEWWEAWAAVDYDRGMALFLDSPDAAWVGDVENLYTLAEMNAAWDGVWGTGWQRQEMTFTDARTTVLAPDIAHTIRRYTSVVTDTAGNQLPEVGGVETLVWVKREGEWKVLLGHESTLREYWQARLEQESS